MSPASPQTAAGPVELDPSPVLDDPLELVLSSPVLASPLELSPPVDVVASPVLVEASSGPVVGSAPVLPVLVPPAARVALCWACCEGQGEEGSGAGRAEHARTVGPGKTARKACTGAQRRI